MGKREGMKTKVEIILLAATLLVAGVQADTFGTGGNQFTVDFVDIGNAGNATDADPHVSRNGYGAVSYNYRMGKYEVTIDQFAKAYAADSRIGNGNEDYWNTGGRTVGVGAPASNVTAYETMKFCNWLTTGDAYAGSYQFNGSGVLTGIDRSYRNVSGLAYVLPTEDEWYKAAYYKPVNDGTYSLYANGSDSAWPTYGTTEGWNYSLPGIGPASPEVMWETGFGGEEQNGTYDMMGNVWEWTESAYDGTLDDMTETRASRGGTAAASVTGLRSSNRNSLSALHFAKTIGFRVAVIPEPSSIVMIGLVSGCAVFIRRKFML